MAANLVSYFIIESHKLNTTSGKERAQNSGC